VDNNKIKSLIKILLLILPFYIPFIIFNIYPIFNAFAMAFYRVSLKGDKFIGLKNFERLINDEIFWVAFKNTIIYALFSALGIAISMILASIIDFFIEGHEKIKRIFISIVLAAIVVTWVSLGMAWRWILGGIYPYTVKTLNNMLFGTRVRVKNPLLLPQTSLISVALITIWATLGYNMVLFIAGLRSIPKEFIEAARIDGATNFEIFYKVVIPIMKPYITFMVVTGFIGAFQIYDPVATLTQGGPYWTSTSLVQYLVYTVMNWYDYGYGAAIGLLILTVVFILSIIQYKIIYKRIT